MAYELLLERRMSEAPRIEQADVPLTFGGRLRRERERREISIASIAESTKIVGALLEGLEHDDVSRWPTGLYRRAFIRAYATSIGLDPEPVIREFTERFPEPDAPLAGPPAPIAPSGTSSPTDLPRDRKPPAVRVVVPETRAWFSPGELIRDARLRFFAVAVDAFVLSVMGLGLFAVLGLFWAPLALATAAYYFASILILGNTPGVCLFATRRPPAGEPGADGKPVSTIAYLVGKILRRNHWREAGASNFAN